MKSIDVEFSHLGQMIVARVRISNFEITGTLWPYRLLSYVFLFYAYWFSFFMNALIIKAATSKT